MFLREAHHATVGNAEILGQFADKEPRHAVVLSDDFADKAHRHMGHVGLLKGCRRCHIRFMGHMGTIAQILPGTEQTHNLTATAHAVAEYFHLAREHRQQMVGTFAFGIDEMILFIVSDFHGSLNACLLFFREQGP